jgi:aryl-alcohol dehydrogenase-like predicted oxidoreductase
MRYRRLGSSDLEVSEISLGSWLTFASGVGFEQTRAFTDAAFEAGINFFDTADVYGRVRPSRRGARSSLAARVTPMC